MLQKQQQEFAQKELSFRNQPEIIHPNSQKKVLKNTATTVQSYNPPQPQPQIITERKPTNVPCFPPPLPPRKMTME